MCSYLLWIKLEYNLFDYSYYLITVERHLDILISLQIPLKHLCRMVRKSPIPIQS